MKNALPFIAVIALIFSMTHIFAQTRPAVKTFVPDGWKLFAQADGDLNNDAKPDAALLIESLVADGTGAHARTLLVLLRNSSDQYDLSVQADKAVPPGSESSGAKLDPASALRIENGIVVTNFSAHPETGEQLDITYRYQYENDGFYLLSATQKGVSAALTYTADYDSPTGNLNIRRRDSSNPEIKDFTEVREMPDIPLAGYDPAMMVFFLSAKAKSGPLKTYTTKVSGIQSTETLNVVTEGSMKSPSEEASSGSPNPNAGLVAWYPFSGNADDHSGEGNAGVVKNAQLTADRNGTPDAAYMFDKKSVISVTTMNSKKKLTVPFSVCAWFMTTNKDSFFQTLVSLGRTANIAAFSLGYSLPKKNSAIYFDMNGRTPFGLQVEVDHSVGSGWHFIVGTVDETTVKLYLDGKLVGSKTVDAVETAALKKIMDQTSMPVEIGRDLPYLGRFFNGAIDDVMLYTRALSEEEVKRVMDGLPGR